MIGSGVQVRRRIFLGVSALGAAGLAAFGLTRPPRLSEEKWQAAAAPLAPPDGGLRVFHLGHSLTGRDMPAMVAQLAQAAGFTGHVQHSQLGWGASLDQHWRGEVPGFETENAHPAHRPARTALSDGVDALIATEMVELRDAIRWHDSARALADWATAARAGNPAVRVYLYETWHRLDDPAGWLERVEADLPALWEAQVLRPAMARGVGPIHLIPAGQALAAVVRAAERGDLPGLASRADFFAGGPQGPVDPIHLNDLGAQVVALAHLAALYHRDPRGLPHALRRADGNPATPLPDAAALAVQGLVWDAVSGYPRSGVARP